MYAKIESKRKVCFLFKKKTIFILFLNELLWISFPTKYTFNYIYFCRRLWGIVQSRFWYYILRNYNWNRPEKAADVLAIERLIKHDFFWRRSEELTLNKASLKMKAFNLQSFLCNANLYYPRDKRTKVTETLLKRACIVNAPIPALHWCQVPWDCTYS